LCVGSKAAMRRRWRRREVFGFDPSSGRSSESFVGDGVDRPAWLEPGKKSQVVGVGPLGRTGLSLAIDRQPGFRRMKAHGQAPHPQSRVQAPGRTGVSCRRDASRPGEALRAIAQSDPHLGPEAQAAGAKSFRQIAVALNSRGIDTERGGKWEPATMRNVLYSGRIASERVSKNRARPVDKQALVHLTVGSKVDAEASAPKCSPQRR
jgi:hypothetical protein